MFNLSDSKISYLLFSPERPHNSSMQNKVSCDKLCSILYAKEYSILPIKAFYENKWENAFIAINPRDNDTLRFDAIHLLDEFFGESIIVKYSGDESASKILSDGSEKPLGLNIYDSNLESKTYLHNGISFSFYEKKRYFFPKKKEDLKTGMIVEYFNNNKWYTKQITQIDSDWDKSLKLLVKYEKVRIECK